ncbi:TB2/DP1, HVA22 family-domain-containing protein [Jimgerdemannia flammicorona]|uniref:Protein YOP1 n=1 Tax=Jimgerdemannia flammicorona TaxID=994334 RepID=A0A433DB07_9FUNG|nr:TB2/DP1, HVA22 family-domain-containing protein [Jimgerdemannia flammicorona]
MSQAQLDTLNNKATYYHAQLDKELSKHAWLNDVEAKTKVSKVYIVLGAGSLLFIAIFFNLAGDFLTDLIGWVYPAYASFKAIESTGHDDDRQWYVEEKSSKTSVQLFMEPESLSNSTTVGPLSPSTRRLTYWTVFGFIQIIEFFSDVVLYWFPFYYLFKTLLVLWLALPQFRGAEVVYTRFLRPQLLRAAPSVDKAVTQAKQQAAQLAADVNEHQE